MKVDLINALKEMEEDRAVRVAILTGRGRGFCAGADLNRFVEIQEDQSKRLNFGSLDLPRAFIQFPKPLIAAVNGPSYGFGATVTLTCDIRLASDQARFSFAFVRIGVTPEFTSSYFLPRLIGYGKAAELVFTARPFDAHEALEIGLVNHVFPHEELMAKSKEMAEQIASMPAIAVQRAKAVLRQGLQSTLEQAMHYEAAAFLNGLETEEHRSAVRRLLEQIKSKKN
jgi:2-(1,2-epoxy-1,2-dihydrophenyl)acetyl-CoA isomerase